MDLRKQALHQWLMQKLGEEVELQPILGDASFRRYFRLQHNSDSFLVMDSPPELEDCHSFIYVARAFLKQGLNVPEIIEADADLGFLLITDFGDQLYHYQLNSDNVDKLYGLALNDLIKIQHCKKVENYQLPEFADQAIRQELDNFTEWFVEKYLGMTVTQSLNKVLHETYAVLLANAAVQPQVCVHRDYHSRNLMILPNDKVGILDFQDAVIGPITYDLVSLVRDCYIDWPLEKVEQWASMFYQKLLAENLLQDVNQQTFLKWFDLMGMQRHLKATFIFARKYLRDDNSFYLQFIPRTLNYVRYVSAKYIEFYVFHQLLEEQIMPAFQQKEMVL